MSVVVWALVALGFLSLFAAGVLGHHLPPGGDQTGLLAVLTWLGVGLIGLAAVTLLLHAIFRGSQ